MNALVYAGNRQEEQVMYIRSESCKLIFIFINCEIKRLYCQLYMTIDPIFFMYEFTKKELLIY